MSQDLGILARRKIEAEIIAPIYDEMRKAIGEQKARTILSAAIRRAAIAAGAAIAERAPGAPTSRASRRSSRCGPRTTR